MTLHRFCACALGLLVVIAGAHAEDAAPVVVPLDMFTVPDGLEVTLWAQSPQLRNPTNIDIDAAGRIWVTEGVNYRRHKDRDPKGDRVVVLEDTDHDGRADRSTIFVQEPTLVAPLGIAVIGNQIVVSNAPDLIVYTDVDGDSRFDPAIDKRVQVRVTAWVEDRVADAIRGDAEFFINTAGVLGEQYLEIVPGHDWDSPPIDLELPAEGSDPPRTDLVVSRLYEVLDALSEVLRDDKDVIRDLLKNSANAVSEVNTMLVENRQQVGALVGSTADLAAEATKTLSKVNQGLGDPRIVQTLIRDADGLLVSAKKGLDTLTPTANTLMADATRVTGLITDQRLDTAINAADKAATAASKAGGLIDNVDGMVTDLRAGKGTAGALLAREEVYADLRELIRDLKRNPWKFFWKE